MEIMKFDPNARKHVMYKETKQNSDCNSRRAEP